MRSSQTHWSKTPSKNSRSSSPRGGSTWSAVARYTEVNQGGFEPDPHHSFAPGPEQWTSLDLVYRYPLTSGWLEAGVGADQRQRDWSDSDPLLGRAYLTWRHDF